MINRKYDDTLITLYDREVEMLVVTKRHLCEIDHFVRRAD
jgi:hypothetical protein